LKYVIDYPPTSIFGKVRKKCLSTTKKVSSRSREYLRSTEVSALMEAAKKVGRNGVRDATIILLMFRHGLRTAELVALKWSQFDLKSGYLEVKRVKHGHDSIQPLRSPELRALRQLQRENSDSSYVFLSERQSPLSTRSVRQIIALGGKISRASFSCTSSPTTSCLWLLFSLFRA